MLRRLQMLKGDEKLGDIQDISEIFHIVSNDECEDDFYLKWKSFLSHTQARLVPSICVLIACETTLNFVDKCWGKCKFFTQWHNSKVCNDICKHLMWNKRDFRIMFLGENPTKNILPLLLLPGVSWLVQNKFNFHLKFHFLVYLLLIEL